MKQKKTPHLTASITLGKLIGYSNLEYTSSELYKALQDYQNKRISKANIYLSAFVTKGDVVLSGQIEPHYKIDFINYPKFPLNEETFKQEIIALAKHLMVTFQQNRIVVTFHNEIIMLEENSTIDPLIKQ